MPISGIVISCHGGRAEAVSARIAAFDGVEVHGVLPETGAHYHPKTIC